MAKKLLGIALLLLALALVIAAVVAFAAGGMTQNQWLFMATFPLFGAACFVMTAGADLL